LHAIDEPADRASVRSYSLLSVSAGQHTDGIEATRCRLWRREAWLLADCWRSRLLWTLHPAMSATARMPTPSSRQPRPHVTGASDALLPAEEGWSQSRAGRGGHRYGADVGGAGSVPKAELPQSSQEDRPPAPSPTGCRATPGSRIRFSGQARRTADGCRSSTQCPSLSRTMTATRRCNAGCGP